MSRHSSTFFQNSPDILCVVAGDGKILEINDAWIRNLQTTEAAVIGESIFEQFAIEDRPRARDLFHKIRTNQVTEFLESFFVSTNGSKKYLSWCSRFDSATQTFLVSARDRTEYQASVLELERSRRQSDAAINSMKEGVITLNALGEVVQFNPAAAEILDVSMDELIGSVPADVRIRSKTLDGSQMPDEIHPCVMALTTGVAQENVVMGIQKRNGEMRWFSTTAIPLFLPGESLPYQVVNTLKDVTVERDSLAALEQKEREVSAIMDRLPALVAYWDRNLQNVYANKSVTDTFGGTVESIRGLHVRAVLGETNFKRNYLFMLAALDGAPQTFETEVYDAEGNLHYGYCTYIPNVQSGEVSGFYSIVTDISRLKLLERDRRDYESKFIAASKMSALGEMAAGIAHEINNPLAIINGKTSLLLTRIEKGLFDELKFSTELNAISATVERIAKTVRGLLSFSRNTEAETMQRANLQKIIEETLDLCREKMKNRGIDLLVDVDTTIHVDCRATQISQILMNLINNACDAVENCDRPWVAIRAHSDANRVAIRVTDSGPTIPPDVLEKIMNPFFTTKEIGKGTGLGLSISKGLAEAHNGHLSIERENRHTCFLLELPIAAEVTDQGGEAKKKTA